MTITDEPITETIPGPPVPDEAPWGRKADGSPRAKPGVKPGAAGPRAAKAPGPRKATSARSSSAKQSGVVDYRPALIALGHLPIGIGNLAIKLVKKEETRAALGLDLLGYKLHLPGIAEAVNHSAQTNAKIANALDKIVAVGPYGEIIAACAPVFLQALVNHRIADPNPAMGTVPPEILLQMVAAS